jgi:glucan biosynthesis protein C
MSVADGEIRTSHAPKMLSDRLYFADNLRTLIIVLVVLHHLAVVYVYVVPAYNDLLTYIVLSMFVAVNQAYFMGLLFLISGYFSLGSLDRKGPKRFFRDRLIRLGVPLVVYFFVLNPIALIGAFRAMPSLLTGNTPPLSWQAYPQLVGFGPTWFVAMLLIFDIGYAIWWAASRSRVPPQQSSNKPPRYRAIAAFILLLAAISYLIRIVVPIGEVVAGFPTLSYLPQYLSFFIIGTVAVRHNWLQNVPKSMGRVGFALVLIATLTLFFLAISGGTNFLGHGSWQSAVYALWDSTVAVGMSLGLITLFRERINWSGSFARYLQRHSYTVYIIQAPIVVFVAVALMGLSLEQLLKFGLASVITVPLCFATAYLVLKIPFASRIL